MSFEHTIFISFAMLKTPFVSYLLPKINDMNLFIHHTKKNMPMFFCMFLSLAFTLYFQKTSSFLMSQSLNQTISIYAFYFILILKMIFHLISYNKTLLTLLSFAFDLKRKKIITPSRKKWRQKFFYLGHNKRNQFENPSSN